MARTITLLIRGLWVRAHGAYKVLQIPSQLPVWTMIEIWLSSVTSLA
jgi:hypothetical protein